MSFRILRASSSLRTARPPLRSRVLLSTRLASTTPSSSFPFPASPNPTPWQIFHLPANATQKDIKARYYELVRRYHPDSPFARSLPPETAHNQFQAVSRAYDMLRGKKSSMAIDDTSDGPAIRPDNDVGFEIWKARQARKADIDVTFDERWKDKMLVGILLFAIFSFVAQIVWTRRRKIGAALKENVSYRRDIKPVQSSSPPEAAVNSLSGSETSSREGPTEDSSHPSAPSSSPSEEWSLGPRI